MTALDQLQLVKLGDICHKNHLIHIEPTATVSDALALMKKHHITCLPVIKDGKVQGIIDIRNVMFFLAWGKYKISPSDTAAAFNDSKVDYGAKPVGDLLSAGQSDGGRVWEFDAKDPVANVIEPFSKGVHRAIVNCDGHRRLLTPTDLCRWVATNHAFTKVTEKTLEELGLYKTPVISAADNVSAIEAFRKASQNEVSAVAIVDHKTGRLVANLSGTDLRGIDAGQIREVEKPVTEFLREHHPSSLNPIVCHKGDTLKYVLFKLLSLKVHRVWVIDANHAPTGIVSMMDVLSKFTAFSPEMQA